MNFMGRIRIPTEIANFLKQEGSQRLLVKGDAGTGKTIFVLSLLRYLSRYSQGIYVSTRVNYSDIYRYTPWVKNKIQKENIIDATNPEGTLLSMESELRYNSAGDFVKIIADKCRLLRVLDMKYGCVIIDSWESLISNIPYSKRDTEIQLERIMVDLSREMKVNLILTVETKTTNRLDYVADGVVLMEKGIIHENRIRTIRLRKLRGVKIVNPVYPFTLDGGKFQALEPESASFEVTKCKRFRKMRASNPVNTSSGIKDFDSLMGGGLRKGSLNLLEVGNGVGFSYIPFITVPVINALTDRFHPCQVLSDIMTVVEKKGSIDDLKVTWVGDGNNMANSWIQAASRFGFELTLACPKGYGPDPSVLKNAQKEASKPIILMEDPATAVMDSDVINCDVWASMGQEKEQEKRLEVFQPYQVNRELLSEAKPGAIVLHCLPAHRGEEITDDVLEGSQCPAFDQAENKMHIHKAILEKHLLG